MVPGRGYTCCCQDPPPPAAPSAPFPPPRHELLLPPPAPPLRARPVAAPLAPLARRWWVVDMTRGTDARHWRRGQALAAAPLRCPAQTGPPGRRGWGPRLLSRLRLNWWRRRRGGGGGWGEGAAISFCRIDTVRRRQGHLEPPGRVARYRGCHCWQDWQPPAASTAAHCLQPHLF